MINNSFRKLTLNHSVENLDYYSVTSPNDYSEIAKVELPNSELQEKIIQEVSDSFKIISKMDNFKIAEILSSVADKIKFNSEYLSLLIASEGGKPLKDAIIEVQRCESTIRECAIECSNTAGEIIPMDKSNRGKGKTAFTKLYPLGAVLAISAFNHPLNLLCHQVGTAIAAKCSIVLKPAQNTCLSAYELYNFFIDSGLEYGIFHILPIDGPETSKIVSDKRFKYVSFIGSEKIGWDIWKKVYPGTKVQFEHGGTGSAIVCADADIDKSVNSLILSSFYHSGQVCVSTQNIFIDEKVYDEFKNKFIKKASELIVGDSRDINTNCGPIIKRDALDRIDSWVKESISQGANVLLGANPIKDNYYEVTILENINYNMKIFKDEVFGPVVNLIKYNNLDEIISLLNSSDFAFQTCIFTQDINLAMYYTDNIEQKACMINENNAFRVDWMPFGGYKKSGFGTGGVKYAIHDMSVEKLIVLNS